MTGRTRYNQVAKAGKACQRRFPAAERHAELSHFSKAPCHEHGDCIVAEAEAVADTCAECNDVLERRAELDADDVRRRINAQVVVHEDILNSFGLSDILGSRDACRRDTAPHLLGALTTNRLVFSSFTADGGSDVWTMDPQGGSQTRLTSFTGVENDPKWSYDHSRVAFVRIRNSLTDIYLADLDSGNTRYPFFVPSSEVPSLPTHGAARDIGLAHTVNQEIAFKAIDLTAPVMVGDTDLHIASAGFPSAGPISNIGSLALAKMAVTIDLTNMRARVVPSG
jgi:hypothetical protein